ncbi:hypothetical protein niasHS_005556 [Heterodera schachtii]|uniref:Uncharacterized protein n=1 Tax=Heterodera schachtii TaxID=97005 RepID=A0ABD2JNC5_HETSC
MRPVDVNFRNATELRNRLYKDVEEHERKPKFKIAAPLDIELQRETEPKTSDKELGRETRPPQLSDKHKTSTIEQERLDLAKRVTEQSWKDTDSSAATAADIAEKAKTALNRAEQARRQAPNAPHAKKLFDNLSNMENNLRKLVEKISHESKKAAEAKRKLSVHYESKNLNECRKQADMAKKALKDSKKYLAELTPMYFSIAPEDKLGVNELANRVVTAVDDFLNAKVKAPRAPEDPKFPAGQPKQHQEKQLEKMKPTVEKELESRTKPPVSKISDKKEPKREPEKATVEKELEREPIKAPEKELERESPKKADKELEPLITERSEKQREPLEEQVDESYLSKKKEEKLDEEKIQIAENIAHEFPSTDYGTEDSENEKTEKWSPEQTKQKVMKGKEDSLEQSARQKNEEATLVKSTDKKEEEEFPSTEYEIEEDNNVLSSSSSSSIVAENKPSETAKTDEGSSLMPQIEEIAETVDGGQKSGTMLPVDFPSYNDDDNMNNVVLMNELPEETLISATPEDELNKSEHNDEDDLPDLPSPQALSTAKQRGEKKEATVVSERKKMLIGHQKQQRKAVEFLFNEITQRFYISIGSGVQHVDASSHLAYVLGFENTRLYYNHPAKYLPDLSGGVRQLYVYAPKLVEDTIIGDRMAPLLRVVNVSGVAPLDVPEVIYTNEFFKPIQNKRISEIKIEIQTAFGRYIKFNWATQQEGKGEQQYFVGTRYQRGGGLLQNVARFLMPVASNLLSSASKEGIAAGTRVLGDLSQGKALKESLETHAKQGFENLAGKLHQCGKGGIYGRDNGRGRRVSKTSVREVLPLSALNQTGPYLFRLFSDSQYCDLSKTYMYLLTSIERKNAAGEWVPTDDAIEEDRHVGVIQNFGSSFIRSLKVNISGVEVFDSSIYYHYRAYIMQELGYSHEIRKAFHEAGCYYSDENSQDSYANKGFTSRVQRFSNGKHCETMVKLNFDLARQNTLLLNNQDIVFTIHRNSDSFLLLTPRWKTVIDAVKDAQGNIITAARVTWHDSKAEYRIRLHDMRLYVRTVDVTSSLNVAISRQLESTPAKYALRKVEMRSIFLGTGRTELSHNVFTSTLPRRLICAFVSTDAYSGARHLSPFNFEHANVRSISAEANGLTFPSTPYLFSFGNQKRFVRAFVDMYAGLGLDDSDNKTVSISMARFLSGWAFFVIPMTSTLDDTPGFELIRQGTCTVKVQFEEPIKADGYEMLILGEFDSVLSINADRVLSTDGSV